MGQTPVRSWTASQKRRHQDASPQEPLPPSSQSRHGTALPTHGEATDSMCPASATGSPPLA